MTDAITQGLSYTVTSDLFGETRINVNGLTFEQVRLLWNLIDFSRATIDERAALTPLMHVLESAIETGKGIPA